jgi:hypothetical protein
VQGAGREELLQGKQQELGSLQQKIAGLIQEESKVREEAEYKLMRQIEEKAVAVRQDIGREAESSGEIVSTLQNYREEEIPALYEGLKVGVHERE